MRVAATRMNPTFSFMDSSFNSAYGCEVAYMGCRTRVIADRHGERLSVMGVGTFRSPPSTLPRLAIKAAGDRQKFFSGLEEVLVLVSKQLMHRYQIQAKPQGARYAFPDGAGVVYRF